MIGMILKARQSNPIERSALAGLVVVEGRLVVEDLEAERRADAVVAQQLQHTKKLLSCCSTTLTN